MDVIDTNDENPLQLSIPSCPQLQSKTSGRPRTNEKTIFSSPPRSIVSLLLRKTMNDKTIKGNSCNNSVSYENNVPKSERKFKEWVCRRCSFRTDNKESLKEHKATHKNKLHQCDFTNCKYSTKFSSNLIKHQRTHTAEKPYICDKCLFRTNFQNSLTVHKRIHTLEKPYACQNCKYRCNSSSNLKKHCSHRHASGEFQKNNTTAILACPSF